MDTLENNSSNSFHHRIVSIVYRNWWSTYAYRILWVLAFLIPFLILTYIVYINYLPFGYSKSYSLSIDENGTIHSSSPRFYLLTITKGQKYSELKNLYGSLEAAINPGVVVKNFSVNASVGGEGVFFSNTFSFDPQNYEWDFSKDFRNKSSALAGVSSPFSELNSSERYQAYRNGVRVYEKVGPIYLSKNNSLKVSAFFGNYTSVPFAVYAEWLPEDSKNNQQEIVGHYDWELLQEKNQVTFMVGRINNASGPFYLLTFPIANQTDFFGKPHSALAIYNPDLEKGAGYLELYVDNNFSGRIFINKNKIWEGYARNVSLSFGKSIHGNYNDFTGAVHSFVFLENFTLKKQHNLDIENSLLLDGTTRIEVPSAVNLTKGGPFTVYAQWMPQQNNLSFTEIVGHFDWELLQEKSKVTLMIGRLNNNSGSFSFVSYPIANQTDFFGKPHSALAIYNPDTNKGRGYIELYIDGNFSGRTNLGIDTIWEDYAVNIPLSFGKSLHGDSNYFQGGVIQVNIKKGSVYPMNKEEQFTTSDKIIRLPIIGQWKPETLQVNIKKI